MGDKGAAPPRQRKAQRQLRSSCVPPLPFYLFLFLLLFMLFLIVFVAFIVLVVPFVFATLVVCAAGAVLNVVVAALAIKQNNKEARRKTKSGESRKANKYKANNRKQTNKKQRSKKTEN